MKTEQSLQLLKESILAVGNYTPSMKFLSDSSVGIAINGKPVILLGWADDEESNLITDRLLANAHFTGLLHYIYGDDAKAEKVVVENSEACERITYGTLTKSEQGVVEDGIGSGLLVALILDTERPDLGYGMCVNSSIMQCIYPEAKPLSVQIELNAVLPS